MDTTEAIRLTLGKGLPDEAVSKVADLAVRKTFAGGDTILRQFDRNSDVLVILQGSAKIMTFSDELIREVGPGSVVGEISLIDDQPRSATVRSAGGTEAAVIPSEPLRQLMSSDSDVERAILRNIAELLCARLRQANIHLDGLMARH